MAFSGGRDSTALLHAALAAAAPLKLDVLALHVHHGLSAHADAWLAHCDDRCRRWARRGHPVTFVAHRLLSRPQAGESIEAWARRERYRALRQMALDGGADLVLLAHHRRDQAETFLLQALRGGGVAALSAMPRSVQREGITWARPWLSSPHEAIESYARRHRLKWIEDDSNADPRFARNRLRSNVWPVLEASFPDAESTLSSAARWAQQASQAIDEIAAGDVAALVTERGLHIAGWRVLSPARQVAALRAWLRAQAGPPAPASLVERLMVEIDAAAARRWPIPGGELHSYRGDLRWRAGMREAVHATPVEKTALLTLDLRQPGVHEVASWRGAVRVDSIRQGGIALALAACLTLRARVPGDRFQAGPRRPVRSLKLQYQSAGVSAHDRQAPILCSGDQPVFVPGLGIDARAAAVSGEPQVGLAWLPTTIRADPAG